MLEEKHCTANKQLGFSLFELLIVLAIIAVISALVYLPMSQTQNQLQTVANQLIQTLSLARNYSISNNVQTVFCIQDKTINNEKKCLTTKDWHDHWLVFVDTNLDKAHSADERVLLSQNSNSDAVAITFGTAKQTIVFSGNGSIDKNDSFDVCLKASPSVGLSVIFSQVGRYRISNQNNGC